MGCFEWRALLCFSVLMLYRWEGLSKECLRCKKIEEERAIQQATNPQEVRYFEDYLSMREDEETKRKESTSNRKKEKEEETKPSEQIRISDQIFERARNQNFSL